MNDTVVKKLFSKNAKYDEFKEMLNKILKKYQIKKVAIPVQFRNYFESPPERSFINNFKKSTLT